MKLFGAVFAIALMTSTLFAADASSELQSLKRDLKRDFPKLSTEEISSAEEFEQNADKTILALYLEDSIYFASRPDKKSNWKFTESISRDGFEQLEFKSQNRFSIQLREGDSIRSETTSTWRLEGDRFKVIGQDSKGYWRQIKGTVVSSVNFLTGTVRASSESENQKKISGECKFDGAKLRAQRLSEMGMAGADEPECKYAKMPQL